MNGDQESQKTSKYVQSASLPTGTRKRNLTQERLKELLSYDPETGIFRWKISRRGVLVGTIAGSTRKDLYVMIRVLGADYLAHRLAWLYVYGYFPENFIDHIDRNPSNNTIVNLREVTQSCNIRNSKGRLGTISGIKGVSVFRGFWDAKIFVDGRNVRLGCFSSKTLAAKARYEAEIKYGFITCDTASAAKAWLDANPVTEEDLSEERERKERLELGLRTTNTSGIAGISWDSTRKRWAAQMMIKGTSVFLGRYINKVEAIEAIHKFISKRGE